MAQWPPLGAELRPAHQSNEADNDDDRWSVNTAVPSNFSQSDTASILSTATTLRPGSTLPDPELFATSREPVLQKSDSLTTLTTILSNLAAIYFVSPAAFALHFGPRSYQYWPEDLDFLPHPPIMIHVPHPGETYIAICVECATPKILEFCDGTSEEKLSWCGKHAEAMQAGCHHENILRGQHIARLARDVVQMSCRQRLKQLEIKVFEYTGDLVTSEPCHRNECDCSDGKAASAAKFSVDTRSWSL